MLDEILNLTLNPVGKYEFERLLNENKPELIKNFGQSKKDIIKMSDQVLEIITHAENQKEHRNEWSSISKIWNVSGFILLASLDLKTYLELLCSLDDNIQRIAITRMVFVQLYEIARNLDELTNKRFVDQMRNLHAEEFINELYAKRKNLNELKKKYEEDLYNVRINVGAHREKDYKVFHEYICNLEYTSSMQMIYIFGNAIDELAETIQKIMNQTAKYVNGLYAKK